MRIPHVILFLLPHLTLIAQKGYGVLKGYVRDSTSGEPVFFARIIIEEVQKVVYTNEFGFFSIRLREGEYNLRIIAHGYRNTTRQVKINAGEKTMVNIWLYPEVRYLQTVEVKGEKGSIRDIEPGRIIVQISQIRKLPVVLGEPDPIRAIRLLPGVQSAGDEVQGLVIRGGKPDQVLVLLDGGTVYNAGHLMGLFSVFNPDIVKQVTLYKGGIPPWYGGRMAGVLDVRVKEGNTKRWSVSGGIGLISSRITVEGPLLKDRVSIMIGGRRTYFDLVFGRWLNEFRYYFYDANIKISAKLSEASRLYLSAYTGDDVFRFKSVDGTFSFFMPWGNRTYTLRYTHIFGKGAFLNLMLIYNEYRSRIEASEGSLTVSMQTEISDAGFKAQVIHSTLVDGHKFRAGIDMIRHVVSPIIAEAVSGDQKVLNPSTKKKYALEIAPYISDEWQVSRRLSLILGLRYGIFAQVGPYTFYTYDELKRPTDSIVYPAWKLVKVYHSPEPRFSLKYEVDSLTTLKFSITYIRQYLQMVSNSAISTPFDLWVPAGLLIKPGSSLELSGGFFRTIKHVDFSVEGFYRRFWNVLEYRDNFVPDVNVDVDYDLLHGIGWSYGIEIGIWGKYKSFSGWLGYTLSWTWYKFDELNRGRPFPSKYDRRHDLSVVILWEPSWRWSISTSFVFGTGNTMTVPTHYILNQFVLIPVYTERNNVRLPPYHRLDISITYRGKIKKKYHHEFALTLYNVYNRQNVFFVWLETKGDWSTGLYSRFLQITLFPFLPALSWNFKF